MTDTHVHLRWDGVCIPANEQTQPSATRLWRNSAALGSCLGAKPPSLPLRIGYVMHDPLPARGTVLRQPARVTIVSTTARFAPGQEWVWIKASIRDIRQIGSLVLQIRDRHGVLVYTERLSRQQVWRLPTGDQLVADQPPANDPLPLRHTPNEPPENAAARARLKWANPDGSPYQVTILTSTSPKNDANSIPGNPALTAAIPPGGRTYEASTPLAAGVDQIQVQLASLSLELVRWRELYETLTGKSADDVPAAAGPDQTTWVQYKLNELGWFAGKLDGDANDPDLQKAIVRYRQSHRDLYKPLFKISGDPSSEYVYAPAGIDIDRRIDPGLVRALQEDTTILPSFDTAEVVTGAVAEGKLYVHAERFCQNISNDFVNDAHDATTTIKFVEERKWLSAPRFPLRARLMVTASNGAPVWAPAVGQSTPVRWRWQDQAEPTGQLPAGDNTTRAYIERVHREAGAARFNNARAVIGGQITGDDATDRAVVFERVVGQLTPAAATDAWFMTTSGDLVFFCPSTIAGDNYELEATVGGRVATTGRMTTWRRIRVAGHVSWGGDPTDVWADVAQKYALAYVEIVAPPRSTMADTIGNDTSLQDAFRRASKQQRWSDDAWLPEPLPDHLFALETVTTTQAMRQRLETVLNGTDRAYDEWRNVDDLAARYVAAKNIIEGWKRGDDAILAPPPAPPAPRTSDPLLLRGWEHYSNELSRLISTKTKPDPVDLKSVALIRWRKSASAIEARFANLLADQRRIVEWDPHAALSKLYRSKVAVFIQSFIGPTQQTVLLELEKLLTPGMIVLEFASHLPRNGYDLDLSYGSQMFGGGKVLVNRGAYRVYQESHLFAHEVAHGLFLKHDKNAQDPVEADHDQSDDNCVMSYVYDPDSPPPPSAKTVDKPHYRPGRFDPEFCGKCNLKLRGWDIRAGSLPTQSA